LLKEEDEGLMREKDRTGKRVYMEKGYDVKDAPNI